MIRDFLFFMPELLAELAVVVVCVIALKKHFANLKRQRQELHKPRYERTY